MNIASMINVHNVGVENDMRRITFIFIALSINCISGYFLDSPLSLFLQKPLLDGMGWHPLSTYLLIAFPIAIAFPIIMGDILFKLHLAIESRLHGDVLAKWRSCFGKALDWIVVWCVIIMIVWAAFPPRVKSFAFDKRKYVFNQIYRKYRNWKISEKDYCGKFRQIDDFKGVVLQDAGSDGLWGTSDDVIRLVEDKDD